MLLTDVPDAYLGRGIAPAQEARGFAISLDAATPWGGGRVEGRIESRGGAVDRRSVAISVQCLAAWLDLPPQLVGQKRFLRLDTYWDLRTRIVPIWLDEVIWSERHETEDLEQANWRPFAFDLPPELPRAFEGTFVAFRWRVEARRKRLVGHHSASLPLLLRDQPLLRPVIRVETTPLGSWRLLEWSGEEERDAVGGACSVRYEERRPEDLPLPGETREQELARRSAKR